jgi:hypothetical protein
MKTNKINNEGTREQIRRVEQTNTNSEARKAVEAAVEKHSTPNGGDVSKQDATEQATRTQQQDTRLPIDAEARKQNRSLPTDKVLSMLHQQLPAAYRVAEVVGRWVWVTFKEQPAAEIRQQLAQFGFHWNRDRQAWQHPCGQYRLSSQGEPREKYSTYFPARIPARHSLSDGGRRNAKPATAAPQEAAA